MHKIEPVSACTKTWGGGQSLGSLSVFCQKILSDSLKQDYTFEPFSILDYYFHRFSGHSLRYALFVYRLIVATLKGIF